MAEALEEVFGHHVRFSITSLSSNTTRSYRSFDEAVDEVVDARVYSGIHFRKADVDAAEMGHDIAHDSLERYFERRLILPRPVMSPGPVMPVRGFARA